MLRWATVPQQSGPKSGGCCAPFCGVLGPHLTQCRLGRVLSPYQVVYASIQPFGHNRPGPRFINTQAFRLACVRKLRKWGCCAAFRGVAGSPSSTIWPGSRPASVPSGILIRPLQTTDTNVTDRTDKQDIGPIA